MIHEPLIALYISPWLSVQIACFRSVLFKQKLSLAIYVRANCIATHFAAMITLNNRKWIRLSRAMAMRERVNERMEWAGSHSEFPTQFGFCPIHFSHTVCSTYLHSFRKLSISKNANELELMTMSQTCQLRSSRAEIHMLRNISVQWNRLSVGQRKRKKGKKKIKPNMSTTKSEAAKKRIEKCSHEHHIQCGTQIAWLSIPYRYVHVSNPL